MLTISQWDQISLYHYYRIKNHRVLNDLSSIKILRTLAKLINHRKTNPIVMVKEFS